MMRQFTLCVLLLCGFIAGLAQSKKITGQVLDGANKPLSSVSVSSAGRGLGITNSNGEFSVTLSSSATSLSFSAIGFRDTTISLGSEATVVVQLTASAETLNDVVVTGYQTVRKSQYAGAATVVTKDKINFVPNASFDNILQGRVPGLLATVGSGQPGSAARVQIRGAGSISGGSDPLYIVDGMPIEAANFRTLNANDFETVDVLRDASATAQYGNRGSNGVIVITTKRGTAGATHFTYAGNFGFTQAGKQRFNMANSDELLRIQEISGLQVDNGLPGWVYSPLNPANASLDQATKDEYAANLDSLRSINTDWKDVFMRQGIFQSHDINLSGGTAGTRFYAGAGYYKEDGIGLKSDLTRYTFRANLDHKTERLTMNLSSSVGYTKSDYIQSEAAVALANSFAAAYLALPYQPLYNTDGTVAVGSGKVGANAYDRLVNATSYNEGQIKSTLSANATYNITKEVYIGGFAGLDYSQSTVENTLYPNTYAANHTTFPTGPPTGSTVGGGFYSPSTNVYFEYVARATAGFRKVFANVHNVDIQAFSEFTKDRQSGFGYTGYGINPSLINTPAGITPGDVTNKLVASVNGFKTQRALYAAMILGRYTYKDKYTINASFRRDGTSQLPKDTRFQNFFAAGATWNAINEDFLKNVNFLSNLRVRLSYGESANADGFYFGYFGYLPTYSAGTYAGQQTTFPSNAGNTSVTWERIKTWNAGVDFGFFKNRITGSVDVYDKKTVGNIISQQLSYTSGFASLPVNAGTVVNKGVEVGLSVDVLRTRDFRWNVGGNIAYNHNEVTDLGQVSEFEQGTELVKVGLPLGTHYSVEWGGVDQATGRPLYYTKDGKLTTVYSDDNRVSKFGTYNAPWIGGFNTGFYFKGISLEGFWSFQQGFKIFNNQDYFQLNNAFLISGFNVRKELLNMWQKPGDITDIQSPLYQREFSSKDIQDASYLRLRNVRLAYTLPPSVVSYLRILNNASFFAQGENLYTWTKWTGFDPEYSNNIAQYQYPTPRTFTFGFNVTFK